MGENGRKLPFPEGLKFQKGKNPQKQKSMTAMY
jgi:hypothetical protein